jgi:hypothetical protein
MNSFDSEEHHLSHDDVLVACRVLLPDTTKLIDFKAENTTISTVATTTAIFEVTAKLRQKDQSTSEVKLVFKLPSFAPSIRKLSETGGYFQHEITFVR